MQALNRRKYKASNSAKHYVKSWTAQIQKIKVVHLTAVYKHSFTNTRMYMYILLCNKIRLILHGLLTLYG